MGLWRTLTERPWETAGAPDDEVTAERARASAVTTGFAWLLFVVSVIFLLSWVAYRTRMVLPGFQTDWQPLREPSLLWWNTAILVAASVSMLAAQRALRSASVGLFTLAWWGGGLLAVAFLVGQWLAWRELTAAGVYAAGNPANAFFFLLTALHGLHLVGGLVAWAWTLVRRYRGAGPEELETAVRLTGAYWHYLLLVWLGLFVLLLTT